jgi:hypothetical protein
MFGGPNGRSVEKESARNLATSKLPVTNNRWSIPANETSKLVARNVS